MPLDHLGCWQDYPRRMAHIKRLSITLVLQNNFRTPTNGTIWVMLQPIYRATSYHTVFDFQGQNIIFIVLFDTYSPIYLIMLHKIENMVCSMICLISGLIITYLNGRSKDCSLTWHTISNKLLSMKKHTFMSYGLLHDTWSLQVWKTTILDKRDKGLHLATRPDTYITDTNKTTEEDKYPRLDKENKK